MRLMVESDMVQQQQLQATALLRAAMFGLSDQIKQQYNLQTL